jgi:hypothetical protein
MKQKFFEFVVSLFLMCVSIYLLYIANTSKFFLSSESHEFSPMWFPKIILTTLFAMSCVIFCLSIHSFYRHKIDKKINLSVFDLFHKKSILTFFLILCYALLWWLIGFSISTFIYFILQTKAVDKERSLKQIVLVSVLFTMGLFVVFSLMFRVNFSEPIFSAICNRFIL